MKLASVAPPLFAILLAGETFLACSLKDFDGFDVGFGKAVADGAPVDASSEEAAVKPRGACEEAPLDVLYDWGTPDRDVGRWFHGLRSVQGAIWVLGGQYRVADASVGFVWRVDPATDAVVPVQEGLVEPTGLAELPDGRLVVSVTGELRLFDGGLDAGTTLFRELGNGRRRVLDVVRTPEDIYALQDAPGGRRDLYRLPRGSVSDSDGRDAGTTLRVAVRGAGVLLASPDEVDGFLHEVTAASYEADASATVLATGPVNAVATYEDAIVWGTPQIPNLGSSVVLRENGVERVLEKDGPAPIVGLALAQDLVFVQTPARVRVLRRDGTLLCTKDLRAADEVTGDGSRAAQTAVFVGDDVIFVSSPRLYRLRGVRR